MSRKKVKEDQEKLWDQIDKLADENGGRYVVRTVPGEVDTTKVSEFIQKRKIARRENNES